MVEICALMASTAGDCATSDPIQIGFRLAGMPPLVNLSTLQWRSEQRREDTNIEEFRQQQNPPEDVDNEPTADRA